MDKENKVMRWGSITVLGIALMLMSLGCLAVGAPTVRTLSADDMAKAKKLVSEVVVSDKIPPQWIAGLVFQEKWVPSYGVNNDPFNKVRIKVFIPNGLATIIPCNPRQEMHFVRDYDPGDLVAFKLPGNNARVSSQQDQVYLCREEIMLVQKGVLGPPIENK